MNKKNEKGITTIDITIAIILITLFVALIATLMYSISANHNTIERKSEATNYAINEIEAIKQQDFNTLQDTDEATNEFENIVDNSGNATGYAKKIIITDYSKLPENKDNTTIIAGLVKKVTVQVSYKDGDTTQTIEISTVLTKND